PYQDWALWKVLKTGEISIKEVEIHCFDGTRKIVTSRVAPIQDASGQIVAIAAMMFDVTERRDLQSRLEQAITYRDDFLSMASHELKTPLTSLKLNLQLTKRILAKNTVDRCLSQLKLLEVLVDDLLDVSRIRSGRIRFHFEETDLAALVRSTV